MFSLVLAFAFGVVFGFSYDGVLSPFAFALLFFFAFLLVFLGAFGLDLFLESWRLEWNKWLVDVEDMGWLFNPMYWTWLLYHNHWRWTKLSVMVNLALTIMVVTAFGALLAFAASWPTIAESFWTGWINATMMLILFAIAFYLKYTSVDRTPSPYPKGRLSDVPRRL